MSGFSMFLCQVAYDTKPIRVGKLGGRITYHHFGISCQTNTAVEHPPGSALKKQCGQQRETKRSLA